MKKILVVSMSAELGGIEKSLINFLKHLDKKECDVDLLLWKKRGELLSHIPSSVKMLENPSPGRLHDIISKKSLTGFFKYLKLKFYTKVKIPWKAFGIFPKEYDVAISYTQDGYSPYYLIDNIKSDKKYLWYHHGAYDKNETERKKDKKYYERFDNVITVSDANKNMLLENFPDIKEKFIIINNLINDEEIKKSSQKQCKIFDGFDGCKLVTVGRVSPEKGQLNSLNVAKTLKEKGFNFKWCFVGDGPDMAKCLDTAKKLNLENECFFVGADYNPYPYIAAADLYVQLSFVEADPVTIQEALVLDKVIIASDIKPIREALEDGKLGALCKTESKDTASVIMNLYKDLDMQEMYKMHVKNRTTRNLSIEKLIDNLFAI